MASSYISLVKAVYDYVATSDDELTIKEDSLYFLLDNSDPEWHKVRAKSDDDDEPSGLVPAAYVEEIKPISVAKAVYDYTATASGELSVAEDEVIHVYEKDDDWWLVKGTSNGGRVGLVPGNYVEETDSGASQSEPESHDEHAGPSGRPIDPSSHGRSTNGSNYHDPADLVAQSQLKAKADPIETWAVTEIDSKGKKKKGTLGIGNGNMFFASESDKTPVRQWPTSSVHQLEAEKAKHISLDVDGANLHFNAGSQSAAEAIVAKLRASKAASAFSPPTSPPATALARSPSPEPITAPVLKQKKSVNFAQAPPEVITSRESEEYDESGGEESEYITGTVLYDFAAEGEDELAVAEGEIVTVVDQGNEDWWKVRNAQGVEGVVPALYVKLSNEDELRPDSSVAQAELAAQAAAAREATARAEREEERAAEEKRRIEERERAEEAKRKRMADQRAAEAAAREADRQRHEETSTRSSPPAMPKRPTSRSGSSPPSGLRPTSGPTQYPDKAKVRTWHDRTGQFRVDAQYLGTTDKNKLRLHKVNGVIIEVPMEKMSPDDLIYIQSLGRKDSPRSTSPEDDNLPLSKLPAVSARPSSSSAASRTPPTRKPQMDWFEFFLNAGCDVDDCTRYASAFERDNIDEAILPDLEGSTLRTLGLREGDIIRVLKHISQKRPKDPAAADKARNHAIGEQVRKDEELARELQARENGSKVGPSASPAPNLFVGGPNGALKNQRRGRPTLEPKPSTSSVGDLPTISATTLLTRATSPQTRSPESTVSPQARTTAPARKPTVSGFDDDAWAPRPSSTQGIKSNTPQPTLSTPIPTPPPPPPIPTVSAPKLTASPIPAAPPRPSTAGGGATTSPPQINIFDKIASMRPPSAPIQSQPNTLQPSPSPQLPPHAGYQQGLGVGGSPAPLGQFLTAQRTGVLSPPNAPHGPFAPVPANQSLLAPLVSTTTGFSGFIPTRPSSLSAQQTGFPPGPPPFVQPQPTGFQSHPLSVQPQPTNFLQPSIQPQQTAFQPSLQPQITGLNPNNFGSPIGFGGGVGFQPTGFQQQPQAQIQQTGSVFDTLARSSPPAPPPGSDTSPANVFASMKAGGFGRDLATPQPSDKYDALHNSAGQPSFLTPQQTGWNGNLSQQPGSLPAQPTGFQPSFQPNGFQPQPTGFQNGFQPQPQFGSGFR